MKHLRQSKPETVGFYEGLITIRYEPGTALERIAREFNDKPGSAGLNFVTARNFSTLLSIEGSHGEMLRKSGISYSEILYCGRIHLIRNSQSELYKLGAVFRGGSISYSGDPWKEYYSLSEKDRERVQASSNIKHEAVENVLKKLIVPRLTLKLVRTD